MEKTPEKQPVVHEDDDPLVVAATKVIPPDDIFRRPGLLVFTARDEPKDEQVDVTRSRFDGTYGNVCRMTARSGGVDGPLRAAPAQFVLNALLAGPVMETCARLMKLYHEWKKKG